MIDLKPRRQPDPPHVAVFLANAVTWPEADRKRVAEMLRRARCEADNREAVVTMSEFLAGRPDLSHALDVENRAGLEGEIFASPEFSKELTKYWVRIGRTDPETGRKFIRFIDDCGKDRASSSN